MIQAPDQEVFQPRMWLKTAKAWMPVTGPVLKLKPGEELYMKVDGRMPRDQQLKLNPLWWAMNSWDPTPPDWSLPESPWWLRNINWWFRNPFHNLGRYVLGVGDRNYIVRIYQRDGYDDKGDLQGWEKGEIIMYDGAVLPWYAYGDKNFTFYYGWQPVGFAGYKLNKWALFGAPLAPVIFTSLVSQRFWSMLFKSKGSVPQLPA